MVVRGAAALDRLLPWLPQRQSPAAAAASVSVHEVAHAGAGRLPPLCLLLAGLPALRKAAAAMK